MWTEQEKFKIKEWRKPPRIRKRNRCCHKLETLKKIIKKKQVGKREAKFYGVDWLYDEYYEISRCKRCGITEKKDMMDCQPKCLNCGEEDWSFWMNEKSWLCPKCYRRTRSRKH